MHSGEPRRGERGPSLNIERVRSVLNTNAQAAWNDREQGEKDKRTKPEWIEGGMEDQAEEAAPYWQTSEHQAIFEEINTFDRRGQEFVDAKREIYANVLGDEEARQEQGMDVEHVGLLQDHLLQELVRIARASAVELQQLDAKQGDASQQAEEIRRRHSTQALELLRRTRNLIGDQKVDVVFNRYREIVEEEKMGGALHLVE